MSYKKQKHLLSYDTRMKLQVTAIGMAVLGIYGIDYIDKIKTENTQQISEQAIISDRKSLEEIQENLLKENAIEISASDLLNHFHEDMTTDAFNYKRPKDIYKGEYLEISGTVNNASASYIDGYHITLENSDPISKYDESLHVYCRIYDEEDKKIMKELEAGDEITVIGKGAGCEFAWYGVNDCDIVKVNGKEIQR
jgi:hypothetical protein